MVMRWDCKNLSYVWNTQICVIVHQALLSTVICFYLNLSNKSSLHHKNMSYCPNNSFMSYLPHIYQCLHVFYIGKNLVMFHSILPCSVVIPLVGAGHQWVFFPLTAVNIWANLFNSVLLTYTIGLFLFKAFFLITSHALNALQIFLERF
jgi:hypothetical protein